MMKTNFDEIVERRHSGSLKWDGIEERLGIKEKDLLPMWVADMDFKTPATVREAISEKLQHGVLGYAGSYDTYYESVLDWMKERYQWTPQKDWMVHGGNLVSVLTRLIRVYSNPGDKVLIQPPVYGSFRNLIKSNHREVVENPLQQTKNGYEIDFIDFEKKLQEQVSLFLLCSPHNPVGRVWSYEELEKMGSLCKKYNVLVIADEVHADLTFKNKKHIPFLAVDKAFEENGILCTAPHKAFNLAGLEISSTFIPSAERRDQYTKEMLRDGYNKPNLLGVTAAEAAYRRGGKWLEEVVDYIEKNHQYLQERLRQEMPPLHVTKAEAGYLAWIDCRKSGYEAETLNKAFIKKGKLLLSNGTGFGTGGEGFFRMNLACPRSVLEEGVSRLLRSFD